MPDRKAGGSIRTTQRWMSLPTGTLALVLVACAHNERAVETVAARAALDLACPQEELMLTVIEAEGARGRATRIRAEGCDKEGAYVYLPSTGSWIASTELTPEIEEREAAFQKAQQEANEEALRRPGIGSQGTYQRGASE